MMNPCRLLVVAYEFAEPLFSGNGTYGRSVVEGLCLATMERLIASTSDPLLPGGSQSPPSVIVDVLTAVPGEITDPLIEVFPVPPSLAALNVTIRLMKVPVPAAKWKLHDWGSGWAEFGEGALCLHGATLRSKLLVEPPSHGDAPRDAPLPYSGAAVVDWHGLVALQHVLGGWDQLHRLTVRDSLIRVVYLNFRVFGNPALSSSSPPRSSLPLPADASGDQETDEEGRAFRVVEAMGLLCCSETVALCKADALMLRCHAQNELTRCSSCDASPAADEGHQPTMILERSAVRRTCRAVMRHWLMCDGSGGVVPRTPRIVLPPVRSEVISFAHQMEGCGTMPSPAAEAAFVEAYLPEPIKAALRRSPACHVVGGTPNLERRLLVCCVRQARDKNPDRFVSLVEDIYSQRAGEGQQRVNDFVIPVVFGATPDPEYSEALRLRLLAACPHAVWLSGGFITPPQLVAIFRLAVLNVHPSLYDAYGLTVVEAAVCRCPTLLHKEETHVSSPVGVVDLLMPATVDDTGTNACTQDPAHHLAPSVLFADLRETPASVRSEATTYLRRLLDDASLPEDRRGDELSAVAARACIIAREYDTAACGRRLAECLF